MSIGAPCRSSWRRTFSEIKVQVTVTQSNRLLIKNIEACASSYVPEHSVHVHSYLLIKQMEATYQEQIWHPQMMQQQKSR